MVDNIVEQHLHSGPWFQYWRRRMAECVGGVLLDDLPDGAYPAGDEQPVSGRVSR
jgi:hypothetical protein